MMRICLHLEVISLMMLFFFFSSRRRHTRLQGDWSSDVCSSDLSGMVCRLVCEHGWVIECGEWPPPGWLSAGVAGQIGRAAGRGKGENSGGAGSFKKKKKKKEYRMQHNEKTNNTALLNINSNLTV